ncbi:MAG TPA: multiheme c-type cytochrome [Planctomycetaceae bacterium]|jgi:hypothetical protein
MAKGLAAIFVLGLIALGVYAVVHFQDRKPDEVNPPGNAQATSAKDENPKPPTEAIDLPAQASSEAQPTKFAERPLFDGWKDPALVLILTGEQHGYVEPCGCSINQLGGLSRRADLFRQLHERGWKTTGFDVGGLVNNPNRKQGKLKFDMMLKCLTDMHYAGIAMGVEELQLTFDFLSLHRPDELPFLSTNVVLFDDPAFGGAPLPKRVVTIGDIKLGVLAVFGPELDDLVRPNGRDLGGFEYEVLPPAEAIKKHLTELQSEKPDLLILLSHSKYDASKELAASFPEFDIIVTAGGPEDPDLKPKYLGEKTLFVAPGQKGKHVPAVGYFPGAGAGKDRFKYELVDLDDKRFKESPKIADEMRFYQEDLLKDRNLVANEPAIDDPRNFDPQSGSPVDSQQNPFVGAKVCGECHKSAYQVWEGSKHAQATETLKTGRDHLPDYISRLYDPECIACHVTGWDAQKVVRYKTGYTGNENPPDLLTGQQCENCHGPGGKHSELEQLFAKNEGKKEDVDAWRKFHRLSVKTAYTLCAKCHDGDNDPNFKQESFDRYWGEIAHPGKD